MARKPEPHLTARDRALIASALTGAEGRAQEMLHLGRLLLIAGGVAAAELDRLITAAQRRANTEARRIDELRRRIEE
jgi:hypothetical protein